MKRTPLKRKAPLRKISKDLKAMRDRTTPDRNDWIAEQGNFCWICGHVPDDYGMGNCWGIDTHEIVRRSEHADAMQRANYFRACRACHNDCHGGIEIEKLLALKGLYDPYHYDLGAIQLMRTKLIDEVKIEEYYQRFINEKGRRR